MFRYRTSGTSRGRTFQCIVPGLALGCWPCCFAGNCSTHISVPICAHIANGTIAHIRVHHPVAGVPHVAVHARVHIPRAHVRVHVRRVVIGRRVHVCGHHVRISVAHIRI